MDRVCWCVGYLWYPLRCRPAQQHDVLLTTHAANSHPQPLLPAPLQDETSCWNLELVSGQEGGLPHVRHPFTPFGREQGGPAFLCKTAPIAESAIIRSRRYLPLSRRISGEGSTPRSTANCPSSTPNVSQRTRKDVWTGKICFDHQLRSS